MIKIQNPSFKIVVSPPSNLGCREYCLLMLDKDKILLDENAQVICDQVTDFELVNDLMTMYYTTSRGENLFPLDSNANQETQFTINRTNCDSISQYHCIAIKTEGEFIKVKTGFHDWNFVEGEIYHLPNSWDEMHRVDAESLGTYLVEKDKFWKAHDKAIKEWNKLKVF